MRPGKKITSAIKQLRKDLGYPAWKMAADLGISRQCLHDFENSENPRIEKVVQHLNAMGYRLVVTFEPIP
jgi:DNA-binding XRE family transcriptional regulator